MNKGRNGSEAVNNMAKSAGKGSGGSARAPPSYA